MAETGGRVNILGLTRPAFEALAGGGGSSRALGRLYRRAFAEGRFEPAAETVGKAAAAALGARVALRLPEIERVVEEAGPFGTTAKALLRLDDGRRVECVRIPVARRGVEPGPDTLCVSTQVGCRMGCLFCESGRMGFARDLRPDEIVGQYAAARLALGWDVGQVVFMGMGEPLDNFDGLAGAIAVLLDESGPAFSQDDLTVCTVGLPEGIARLKALGLKRLNLSVSLNAPDDGLRGELMPATRGIGLEALAAALAAYPQRRNFALAVNYCLMPGRNDGEGAAEGVAAFVRAAAPNGRAVVNVIPYNPGPAPVGRAPGEAEVEAFVKRLRAAGVYVKLRTPRGRALMAACGQLGRAG
ncbi:MAG: radical SAM protein [Candidatus Aminicenantes bacterium]|nr:radical SAM protein [Candidatus Aminicenantes bacterium]NLH78059.1 radical SAM protein [Acidobacteriota bacterium]